MTFPSITLLNHSKTAELPEPPGAGVLGWSRSRFLSSSDSYSYSAKYVCPLHVVQNLYIPLHVVQSLYIPLHVLQKLYVTLHFHFVRNLFIHCILFHCMLCNICIYSIACCAKSIHYLMLCKIYMFHCNLCEV